MNVEVSPVAARTTSPSERLSRILVQGVGLRLGTSEVLKEVSLEVRAGELYGLVGPNGSGKSSLLGVLSGLQPRFEGRVEFQFADGSLCTVGSSRTDGLLGVVFQNPSLDGKLSARENLELSCALNRLPRKDVKACVDKALEDVGLSDAAPRRVSELSGGMRRRLDLARALLPKPPLLFLDEPTTGIDEASYRAFWTRLETYRRETGATVVMATHRPEEAEACSRVALFARGRVVEVEEPAILKRKLARDVVYLTTHDEAAARTVEEGVARAFAASGGGGSRVSTRVTGKTVLVEADDAHALVPRMVEMFPRGTLLSVELRAASMADVFLKITGQHLEA